jgi:holo-[acyl-carrier protein] synthase
MEASVVKGIGIDMASISEIDRIGEGIKGKAAAQQNAFVRRTFSERELAAALERHNPAEYLAGRFAAKEAVFKAVAPLTKEGFDLRRVETLTRADGSPYVVPGPELSAAMEEAGISELLVSITNEDDYAVAMVLAQ